MSRLRRFLHLERERDGSDEAPPAPSVVERFSKAEDPHPEAPARPRSTLDRFAPEAETDVPLELADDPGARTFVRCAYCGRDHNAAARVCTQCGRDLLSRMQRDFNDNLWQTLTGERESRERVGEDKREAALRDLAARTPSKLFGVLREYNQWVRELEGWAPRQHPLITAVVIVIMMGVFVFVVYRSSGRAR
jgi:hypothetical protein